jgi:transcriptional regulator with XRE-family HTH domain
MTQPPALDWSARLALTIAGEVRRHRQAQGLSAQQLAERCAAIGMPIQRSVLANLESGRRTTVNVAEVLVLARALNVPPGILLFPVGYQMQTELLPGGYAEPGTAVEWLAGRTFFDGDAADSFFDTPLGLVRIHQDQVTSLRRTIRSRDHSRQEFAEIAQRYRGDEERYVRLENERAEVYRQLEAISEEAKAGVSRGEAERSSALYERHQQLIDQREHYASGARQYRYAAQRVQNLEDTASKLELHLREIRDRMKAEGLEPPLLPRVLSYIDPERPVLEDIPAKKLETSQAPSNQGLVQDAIEDLNIPMASEEPPPPLISPEQQDEARGILEEMKPFLADIIAEAMDKYAKRKRESEGE